MTFIRHPQARIWFVKGRCGSKCETEENVCELQEVIFFICKDLNFVKIRPLHIFLPVAQNEVC